MFADQTVELLPARTTMQIAVSGGAFSASNSGGNAQVGGLAVQLMNSQSSSSARSGNATNFQFNFLAFGNQ